MLKVKPFFKQYFFLVNAFNMMEFDHGEKQKQFAPQKKNYRKTFSEFCSKIKKIDSAIEISINVHRRRNCR